MKIKKLLIAIPAFNEAGSIGKVLDKIPKRLTNVDSTEVVVVDDGSTDNTSLIVQKRKVRVIRHMINRGLGASLATAFEFARKRKADLLVTLDADGQHNPFDIGRIIIPIIESNRDIVIGSRLLKTYKSMPKERKMVNLLANILTYFLSGVWSSDSQSGFRAFSKKAINKIKLITQRMEVSSEIFSEINKNKLSYSEIPIRPIYTKYSLQKGQSALNAPNVFWKLLINLARR